jgi:hypothetical protein
MYLTFLSISTNMHSILKTKGKFVHADVGFVYIRFLKKMKATRIAQRMFFLQGLGLAIRILTCILKVICAIIPAVLRLLTFAAQAYKDKLSPLIPSGRRKRHRKH